MEFLENKKRQEDDAQFPDEVDVPFDKPARQRFARYRGVKNFSTSYWDPKESLPPSYSRIFQLANYAQSAKWSKKINMASPLVPKGSFVTIILQGVPVAAQGV